MPLQKDPEREESKNQPHRYESALLESKIQFCSQIKRAKKYRKRPDNSLSEHHTDQNSSKTFHVFLYTEHIGMDTTQLGSEQDYYSLVYIYTGQAVIKNITSDELTYEPFSEKLHTSFAHLSFIQDTPTVIPTLCKRSRKPAY